MTDPKRISLRRLGKVGTDERGASAVEFALIAPLFFGLVLGLFSGGQAYDQSLSVTHAVREGARRGVTTPIHQYGTGEGALWVAAIKQVTEDRSHGNLTVPGAAVCVSVVSGANTVYSHASTNEPYTTKADGTSCFNDGGADGSLRVQVLGTRPAYVDVALIRMNITLSSRAVGKIEEQI